MPHYYVKHLAEVANGYLFNIFSATCDTAKLGHPNSFTQTIFSILTIDSINSKKQAKHSIVHKIFPVDNQILKEFILI